MALVVDIDPLSPTCNSFVSVAYADEYVTTRVQDPTIVATWKTLATSQKSTAVVNASRFLDMACEFIGDRYSRDQRLNWPRVNAWVQGFMLNVLTFPENLVEATVEMALFTMANDGSISVQGQEALQQIQVGPIHIKFNDNSGSPAYRFFPDIVAYLLRDLGQMQNPNVPSAKAIKTVSLVRA